MLGSQQLDLLLGSIGGLSAGLATAWLTYYRSRYVLSVAKSDCAKLRAAMEALAGNSASVTGGPSE
nr:Hypothetical protein [Pseudomonas aeruginosa]